MKRTSKMDCGGFIPMSGGRRAGIFVFALMLMPAVLSAQQDRGPHYPIPGFVPMFEEEPRGLYLQPGDSTLRLSAAYYSLPTNLIISRTEMDSSVRAFIFRRIYRTHNIQVPTIISVEDYFRTASERNLQKIWEQKIDEVSRREIARSRGGKIEIVGATIAGQDVALRVAGNINIKGGVRNEERSQVAQTFNENQNTSFKLDQKQQFNIEGTIGDKISVLVDQDSERDFDFENALKIHYLGTEDEVIKRIDAGNIDLSLPGTQFAVSGGRNQGLFGLKGLMKFGGLDVTAIASVERGKKEKISLEGGSTSQEIVIDDQRYMSNTYFFLDDYYRENLYPLRGGLRVIDESRKIALIDLYQSTTGNETGNLQALAVPDPDDPQQIENHEEWGESAPFKRLERNVDYIVDEYAGYVRMNRPLYTDDILAAVYRDADDREFGGKFELIEGDSMRVLKLIKKRSQFPGDPTYKLELKNVYYLGASNINEEGFDLKIVYYQGSSEPLERLDGKNYLEIFGLDSLDVNEAPNPDEKIDTNDNIVNFRMGELWFPSLMPFSGLDGPYGVPHLPDNLKSPELYFATTQDSISAASKFRIVVSYKNRSSTLSLGFGVIEGSEEVRLNDQLLQRGSDYTIDYFSGTLTLLREDANDPGANLDVKYEKNEIFQLDKKALLGTRAEYRFGEDSFLGGTFLFYSKSSIDEKVRVGEEPMRNLIWDINGKYSAKPDFITRAVNALPLLKTDQRSLFTVEGEVAQIMPNPNTLNSKGTNDNDGVAYIDDFESSKRTTSLTVNRRHWTIASPPEGYVDSTRGFLYWYNPYGRVNSKDIWPDKETGTQAGNNLTDVLTLVLDPEKDQYDRDKGTVSSEQRWGGVMRALSPGYFNQTQTKFVEIWVQGTEGQVNVDLGLISEDANDNGLLDTEDIPEGGAFGNDLLDPGEDIGLDQCADEFETGMYPTRSFPLPCASDSVASAYDSDTNPDPNNDNFSYRSGSNDYRRINGTERNENDEGGYLPDTEDLNRNTIPDFRDAYFEYSFWLDGRDNQLIAGGQSNTKGWRLYRIPLKNYNYKSSPSANFQDIQYVRVWITGMTSEKLIRIATIELVGNEWQELGVKKRGMPDFDPSDSSFAITVVNTEDNSDLYDGTRNRLGVDNQPPPGVEGVTDRITRLRAKEQSLVLKFDNLGPGDIGAARKVFFVEQDIVNYKKIKMFVNYRPDSERGVHFDSDSSFIEFFMRLGRSDDSYYEITEPVYPGWDVSRNSIEIDMGELTRVKREPGNTKMLQGGKRLRAVNNPSVTRIKQLVVGVRNRHDVQPISGEVWIDELRVSGIERQKGMAARVKAGLKIADVANVNIGINRRDAEFHNVSGKIGNAGGLKDVTDMRINAGFNLNKFLPARWGIGIPVNSTIFSSKATPKYMPGTDILSSGFDTDSVMTVQNQKTLGVSFRKNSKSKFFLTKYTLDKIGTNLNILQKRSRDTQTKDRSNLTYNGGFSYNLPIKRTLNFKPLRWLKPIPWLGGKVGEQKFYYMPTGFNWSIKAAESKTNTLPRRGIPTETYQFNMNRDMKTGVQPLDALTVNYNRNWKNDLHELRGRKSDVFTGDFGILLNTSETVNTSFNPKIFSWFTTNFGYNTSYTLQNNINVPGNNLSNQNQVSTSFVFNLKKLTSVFSKPDKGKKKSKSTRGGRRRTSRRNTGKKEGDGAKEQGKSQKPTIIDLFRGLTDKLQPVNLSFGRQRRTQNPATLGKPSLKYKLGFTRDPGAEKSPEIAQEVTIGESKNYSARSGLNFTRNITSTFGFTESRSRNRTSSNNVTISQVRDYFPRGERGEKGFPFVSWNVRWSGLEKLPLLSKIANTVSLEHGYGGKETRGLQEIATMDTVTVDITGMNYSSSWQPLVGMSFNLKKEITASFRYGRSRSISNTFGLQTGTRVVNSSNVSVTVNYSRRTGLRIPIFFLRDLKLDNQVTFSLTFDKGSNEELSKTGETATEFAVNGLSKNWKLVPQVSYSFNSKVTGGIYFEFGKIETLRGGTTKHRDFGLNVNIAIRG